MQTCIIGCITAQLCQENAETNFGLRAMRLLLHPSLLRNNLMACLIYRAMRRLTPTGRLPKEKVRVQELLSEWIFHKRTATLEVTVSLIALSHYVKIKT